MPHHFDASFRQHLFNTMANVPPATERSKFANLKRMLSRTSSTPPGKTEHASAPAPTAQEYPISGVRSYLKQDRSPECNPIHKRLPEEHRKSWREEQRRSQALHDSAPRLAPGPVPRSFAESDHDRAGIERGNEIQSSLDKSSFTPTEQWLFQILDHLSHSSFSDPVLQPGEAWLHVESADVEALKQVQSLLSFLPQKEKRKLYQNLSAHLPSAGAVVLEQILFRPRLQITSRGDETAVRRREKDSSLASQSSEQDMHFTTRGAGDSILNVRFDDFR